MLTTGEIIHRERKNKNLTIEDIEKKTRIRKKYLTAIENNDWTSFPSKMYIIGTLKSYARFLDLDEQKIIAFFRREYEKKEDIKFKKQVPKHYLTPQTKRLFKLIIFIIGTFFVLYFGYQLLLYFAPPKVTLLKPTTSVFRHIDKVELVGKTEKEAVVSVNGERVLLDKNAIFKTQIPLTRNKNKVVIEVIGANGKKTIVTKEFEKKE